MNTDVNRYNNYLIFHESSEHGHWVTITYQAETINQSVFPISQPYVTRHYQSADQARMHALGWIECMNYYEKCKQIPNDNRDYYENRYRERLDEFRNNLPVFNNKLELAYSEGWETKLKELNNIN